MLLLGLTRQDLFLRLIALVSDSRIQLLFYKKCIMIRITFENTRLSYLIADFKLTKWNADYVQVLHTNTIAQGYRVIKNWYFRNMSFVYKKIINIFLSRFIYHSRFQEPIGHDDFYLNGGETQPWCSPLYGAMCSTKISYDLLTAIFEVLPSHFNQIFLYNI